MLTMTKIKNMQTTPTETSIIKGLVSHGMTKDLSKEVYKFVKGLIDSSPQKAGKATPSKAPHGPEYATKFDLLEVKMALKEDISAVRADLKEEISAVRADLKDEINAVKVEISAVRVEIKDVKNDLLKWFVGMIITLGFAIIGALKYFIH